MDQPQAVKLDEMLNAFRFRQRVGFYNVPDFPLIEHANGNQKQLRIGHQLPLLFFSQGMQTAFAHCGFIRQFRQGKSEQMADRDDAVNAESAQSEHAFYTRL